ncbi:hypothetical protein K402DRAFT_405093 [Aulographum hederae CBS 113979]|uniref:Uncharacterized protein n=1 Tax=Aulographum hederae CBS 113979 TaxID=1176131 RepID=A0A6G1GXY3_9PEZI|nr:hypothetical protein K402DRAFT_405093 [Aulographum hederae CBS 113979]
MHVVDKILPQEDLKIDRAVCLALGSPFTILGDGGEKHDKRDEEGIDFYPKAPNILSQLAAFTYWIELLKIKFDLKEIIFQELSWAPVEKFLLEHLLGYKVVYDPAAQPYRAAIGRASGENAYTSPTRRLLSIITLKACIFNTAMNSTKIVHKESEEMMTWFRDAAIEEQIARWTTRPFFKVRKSQRLFPMDRVAQSKLVRGNQWCTWMWAFWRPDGYENPYPVGLLHDDLPYCPCFECQVDLDAMNPPTPKDTKPDDPKPDDPKPDDPKPKDPKPKDTKPDDPKPKDQKPEDANPKDPKPEGPKPKDKKPDD